jgi:MarR family transcriptional regulator, lower aerobic nicotinate degradation pathway regulator
VTGPVTRAAAATELMDSLVRVSFTVTALLSRVAAEHDLSLTQLRVLAILRDREPTMAELATYLGLERSSVSGLIDRAVKRGLVRRDPSSDDGRSVRLSLTPDGRHLASAGADEVAAHIAPMTGTLTPADQKRLGALLDSLQSNLFSLSWVVAAPMREVLTHDHGPEPERVWVGSRKT